MSSWQKKLQTFYQRNDPQWLWLEDQQNPQVREFVELANQQSKAWFDNQRSLIHTLEQEQQQSHELAESSFASELQKYRYFSKIGATDNYRQWFRQSHNGDKTELILDLAAFAQTTNYAELGEIAISPDETWLAWTIDNQGDEFYSLYIRQLPNGLPIRIAHSIAATVLWAADNQTLLFIRYDQQQRANSVWCWSRYQRRLRRLYLESNPQYWVNISKTRSQAWFLIESFAHQGNEIWLLNTTDLSQDLRCVFTRQEGLFYQISHRFNQLFCLHNRNHWQNQVDYADLNATNWQWQPLVRATTKISLEKIDAFDFGLVISERDLTNAQGQLRLLELASDNPLHIQSQHYLAASQLPATFELADNPLFSAPLLYCYEESYIQPPTWYAYNRLNQKRQIVKQKTVLGQFATMPLQCQRLMVAAEEGVLIPVDIIARADLLANQEPMPTLLEGYGAYGETLEPWFSFSRLSLLARGVLLAIAHVRGGGELGEAWYQAGKLLKKKNSFNDFLTVQQFLVDHHYCMANRCAAIGASAGGLLVAAAINLAPSTFSAAILEVPFVDVLRTMLNKDLALTESEYQEWGNPQQAEFYQIIRAYSPLDNLTSATYPALLINSSWFDSRVPYWEPTKLFARLLMHKNIQKDLLLATSMTGHSGPSARFAVWHEIACQYAFLLVQLDCITLAPPTLL